MASSDTAERWARSSGFMDKIPPARARYSDAEEVAIEQKLAAAAERRMPKWVKADPGRPFQARTKREQIKITAFVPILEASNLCRKERGEAAFTAFWDALVLSVMDGEFDGTHRLHVVDNQPVIRMRFRSEHMRALTSYQYTYDDVVLRRLARCWLSRRSATSWCERTNVPVPSRWQLAPERKSVGRPSKTGTVMAEFQKRHKAGDAFGSAQKEAKFLIEWARQQGLPADQIPSDSALRRNIGNVRKKK